MVEPGGRLGVVPDGGPREDPLRQRRPILLAGRVAAHHRATGTAGRPGRRAAAQRSRRADAEGAGSRGSARFGARGGPLDCGPPPAKPDPLDPEPEPLYVTLVSVAEPMLRGDPAGQGFELARL